MNDDDVIYIPPVVSQSEVVLTEMIKRIQIEIGKDLGSEIADWNSAPGLRIEKALALGKSPPIASMALDETILRRIDHHGLLSQILYNIDIVAGIVRINKL